MLLIVAFDYILLGHFVKNIEFVKRKLSINYIALLLQEWLCIVVGAGF